MQPTLMSRPTTILIADDDPHARYVVQTLLAQDQYALLTAENGAQAMRMAVEQVPDLILLDVMMPILDGFEVCRQIREHPTLREIPVLLITSLGDHESRVRGLSIGADGFIVKPFDNAELLAQVRTIARLNRYRRLLAEQARFQRLIELSPEGIAIIDGDSRLLLVNPALVTLLGAISAEELLGQRLATFIAPAAMDRYYGVMSSLTDYGHQTARCELVLTRLDDNQVPVEMNFGRFSDDGAAYAQIIIHDITERKRAEAQIQRQISQLTSLHAIGVAITASLELNVTLDVLLDRLIEQLNVDAASVLLLNRNLSLLELAASRGLPIDVPAIIQTDDGLAGMAFLSHRPVAFTSFDSATQNNPRDQALASVFASYFAVPLLARGEVKGVLEIMNRTPLAPDQNWWVFLKALAMQAAIAIDTAALFEQLQRAHAELKHSYDATIEGWSRALDLRDHETEGHSERVTELSLQLARKLNVSAEDLDHIRRGALLHDIGKMGVPDRILLKPGPLNAEEWIIMRQHPMHAFQWLAPIPFLRPALAIPYAHHERWDGSGYPRGLHGEQIPLAARIFAVIDVWDALRSNRPYRNAWSEEQVITYLRSLAGTHFDPKIIIAFLEMIGDHTLLLPPGNT